MIPLVRSIVHALLWDAMAARRWLRGFLLWAATVGAQVTASGLDAAAKWTGREWAIRLLFAALAGSAGMINLGDKNPPGVRIDYVPPSAPGPSTLTTRGFVQLPQIVFLVSVGLALFLYAMAHAGAR